MVPCLSTGANRNYVTCASGCLSLSTVVLNSRDW